MTYETEFPDFGAMPADVPAAWADSSWHNDACPSYEVAGDGFGFGFRLFVDYADKAKREFPESSRFSLHFSDHVGNVTVIAEGDDWPEMREAAERARLAYRFAMILKRDMSLIDWCEMRSRNRHHAGTGICASHDFRDANEDMAEAFAEVFGDVFAGADSISQENADRWNAAWDLAKRHFLTAPNEESVA